MEAILIEDDSLWQNKLLVMLDELGISVQATATTLQEAIVALEKKIPQLLVADVLLQHDTVFKLYHHNKQWYNIPTVFITLSDKEVYFKQAQQVAKHFYIVKPIQKLTLKSAIETVCNLAPKYSFAANSYIEIKGKRNEKIKLPFDKIVYVEQLGNYSHLQMEGSKSIVIKKIISKGVSTA